MRWMSLVVIAAVSVTAGWLVAWSRPPRAAPAVTYHTGPTIEQVQALSTLVTTRVEVADLVESRLDGRTGGIKAAILVKGDVLLGVDLSAARFEAVDQSARSVTLVLPPPSVTSPRLDHERTRVFAVTESGLWRLAPGGVQASATVVDRGYRDAQRYMAATCEDPSLLARARRQAELVLATFFQAGGWNVRIRWES